MQNAWKQVSLVHLHTTPIADMDQVAANPQWTAGNTEVALCAPGERLLGTGFVFDQQGNNEVTFVQVQPFVGAINGTSGRMATNTGGSAQGQIIALCLK